MTLDEITSRLEGVRSTGRGVMARCPAHPDKTPSLSVHEGDRGILLRCFAGCDLEDICRALGFTIKNLFFDASLPSGRRSLYQRPRLDRVAIAFRFELAALDRRRRAETVLMAARGFHSLTDAERDRLIRAVVSAYDDLQLAQVFEDVSDTLRWTAGSAGRGNRHAA